jgi:sulfite reductase beta subunit-like hemoprotein
MQQKREATIDQLREHYAQDDLGIDEFEQRVEMRYLGEPEKEARQRRKAEKRARKRVHE